MKIDKRTQKLYKQAIEKWGIELQFMMLIEESAELIQAVSKIYRTKPSEALDKYYNLFEEMADVHILIHQILYNYDKEDDFDKLVKEKIIKLKKMLKEKK